MFLEKLAGTLCIIAPEPAFTSSDIGLTVIADSGVSLSTVIVAMKVICRSGQWALRQTVGVLYLTTEVGIYGDPGSPVPRATNH